MYPEIQLFGVSVSTYGICVSVGLILMGLTAFLLGRRYKILFEDILFGELFSLLGAFIGAHILYVITYSGEIFNSITEYLSDKDFGKLLENLGVYTGGMVFYGGLIGGLLFGTLYCKFRKIDLGHFSDCFAVTIPLFHCFGRIGCFLSGCCYGIESDFGFTATHAIVSSCNLVNRFPVQLLESAVNLLIFITILVLFLKRILNKRLIFVYLIIYGIARFFIEFLRDDAYRGFFLYLSTSQWISIILTAVSIIILIKKNKTADKCYTS